MAVNIGPKIGIDGEAEYRKQINNIIQQAKTLDSEMKLVASTFDKNATAQEKAAKTGSVLAQQIDTQKDRVKLLSEMLKKSAQQYGINSDNTLKWQQAVNEAKTALNKMESEMEDNKEAAKGLGKELDNGGKKAINFADILKANILSDAIIGGFRALGSAIKSATNEFIDFAKEGINLASDLDEVQNVVDTTFGESGAAKIESFSKSAATSFGLSELSAKQFNGTMGSLLKSMGLGEEEVLSMSTSLAGLAGDMASFHNLDPAEAFEKLRSGISGETEPLKALGINMSVANLEAYALAEGITKAYKDMTQAEQATLRYNYIMKATADAQGDFAKTCDSYANQQRILQLNIENLGAALGKKLLPTVTEFTTALNNLLSGNVGFYEFTQQMSNLAVEAVRSFASALPEMLKAGGQFVSTLLTGIMEAAPQLLGAFFPVIENLGASIATYLPIIMDFGVDIITTIISGFGNALPTLIPQAVDALLGILNNGIVGNLDTILQAGFDLVLGLVEGLTTGLPNLIEGVSMLMVNLTTKLIENLPLILEMGVKITLALVNGLLQAVPKLLSASVEIGEKLVDKFKKINWKQLGKDIVQGIINGVQSMGTALWNTMKEMANRALQTVKDALGIHSPSRAFEEQIGEFLPPGISSGVKKALPAMIRNLKKEFAVIPSLTVPETTIPATSTTNMGGIYVNIYTLAGQDVNQIADAVINKIQNAIDGRRGVFA